MPCDAIDVGGEVWRVPAVGHSPGAARPIDPLRNSTRFAGEVL